MLLVIEIPSAVSNERTSSSSSNQSALYICSLRSNILRSETVFHVVQRHVRFLCIKKYSSIPSLKVPACLAHLSSRLSYLAPRSPLWPSLDTPNSDSSPLVGWVQAPPALLSSNPTEDVRHPLTHVHCLPISAQARLLLQAAVASSRLKAARATSSFLTVFDTPRHVILPPNKAAERQVRTQGREQASFRRPPQ